MFDYRACLSEAIHAAIVTTDCCPAKCAHCLMSSGPDESQKLSLAEITSFVDDLIATTNAKVVVFTGGEATLLGDDLFEAISYCVDRGLLTRLVTNAWWATSDGAARSMIRDLRDSGLSEINFSTDDFHVSWIPLENVKRAWEAAKNQGFLSALVAVCSGPKSEVTPEKVRDYLGGDLELFEGDDELKRLLARGSKNGTRYLISSSQLSKLGRANSLPRDYFSRFIGPANRVYGGCSSFFDPPTLNPDGTLGVCCGLKAEGNLILNLGPASEVLVGKDYVLDEYQGFLLKAIQIVGPAYLYHLATEKASAVVEAQARTACEICEKLTTSEACIDALRGKREIIERQIEVEMLYRGMTEGQA